MSGIESNGRRGPGAKGWPWVIDCEIGGVGKVAPWVVNFILTKVYFGGKIYAGL